MLPVLCQTPQSSVETDIAGIKTEIKNLKETINNGFDNIQKNFDRQNNIIIACIGIPWAILDTMVQPPCAYRDLKAHNPMKGST